MERRNFIKLGFAGFAALLLGQGCNKKSFYEGNIETGVGRFCSIPNTNLVGIIEKGFDASELVGKRYKIRGKEKVDVISWKNTGFLEIKEIIAEDGSQIYKREKNKGVVSGDIPSRKPLELDRYLLPEDFTYKNEESWKKLDKNKIKLIGSFSPDYQEIYVQDEKDKETNKIKVNKINDWVKYQLQSNFLENKYGISMQQLEIYAIIKKTFDAEQRTKTRELFSADINYILPQKKINSVKKNKKSQ